MITVKLKLKLTKTQESKLNHWLWNLTGVYNWVIRKIELDAVDKIYHSEYDFIRMLSGHSKRMGVASTSIVETARTAYVAWERCFNKISRKPKFKGKRNKLNSIPFRKDIFKFGSEISLQGFDRVKFHKQDIPEGKIKTGRIIKRASGWYLSLTIETSPRSIEIRGNGAVGIDPGFKTSISLSNGDKIEQPKEFALASNRLAQAQRGGNKKLSARLQERIGNRRKDNNHKLSRKLISNNRLIVFSKDNIKKISKRFGKSVMDAGHFQLRSMLAYKSSFCGRQYIEVNSRYSTKTCSSCGLLSGPSGMNMLAVRFWECSVCGTHHDRDTNAAINTLKIGLGMSHGVLKPQE